MNLQKRLKGRFAVVTGASSGIGLCFCRVLAENGCALLMVSNQREELVNAAAEIQQQYGVKAIPHYADLTDRDQLIKLIATVDGGLSDPDILINNAGIFSFQAVSSMKPAKIESFLRLHVDAVTMLSREFALRFRSHGKGSILNMSSMSCWMPMPGIALYSATKAYIRVFSRALHYEMKESGVTITVACPGGIATDLFGLPESLKKLAVRIGALDTPERFARNAVKQMLRGRKQYINGFINRLAIVIVALLPTPVRMQIKHRMLDRGIKV
ncbi:MAG: SDR family NAD(P)-dependent oxidoreductase [Muribaculaceae bacterium]|nr:SDR family NAD(P)-dependent oxidoreductase [Muribaculaceae bacterium]